MAERMNWQDWTQYGLAMDYMRNIMYWKNRSGFLNFEADVHAQIWTRL